MDEFTLCAQVLVALGAPPCGDGNDVVKDAPSESGVALTAGDGVVLTFRDQFVVVKFAASAHVTVAAADRAVVRSYARSAAVASG